MRRTHTHLMVALHGWIIFSVSLVNIICYDHQMMSMLGYIAMFGYNQALVSMLGYNA